MAWRPESFRRNRGEQAEIQAIRGPREQIGHSSPLRSALLAIAGTTQAARVNAPDTSLQMFQWSWNDIATECTEWLGPQGLGTVQIWPPGAAKQVNSCWGVYQPLNYVNLDRSM